MHIYLKHLNTLKFAFIISSINNFIVSIKTWADPEGGIGGPDPP